METRNFETSFNLQRVRQDSGLMNLFFVSQRLFQPIEFSFRSLIGWIQAIKLRKRKFDRLEKPLGNEKKVSSVHNLLVLVKT